MRGFFVAENARFLVCHTQIMFIRTVKTKFKEIL